MKITRRFFLVTLIAVLILTACDNNGEQASDDTAAEPQATFTSIPAAFPALPTATPTSAPAPDQATATPADSGTSGEVSGSTEGSGFLDLSSLKADPQELSTSPFPSYRLDAEWSVEPKEGSGTPAASTKLEVLHNSDPLAEELTVIDATSGVTSTMIHIGTQLWINSGEQWIEVSSEEIPTFDQMFFSITSATAGLGGNAEYVGEEDLGVRTKHYRFNNSILGAAASAYNNIQGDVWVTEDDRTVIKYEYTAEDDTAKYRWSWLVSGFGETFPIEPPASAQGQREDIPTMANATDKIGFGGTITYQTTSSPDEVVQFYRQNMPPQGWVFDEANSSVFAQLSTLVFTKGDETAQITVVPNAAGGSQVMINSG